MCLDKDTFRDNANIFFILHYIFVNLNMSYLQKENKRYNNQLDNYSSKYADTFKLGLIYPVI